MKTIQLRILLKAAALGGSLFASAHGQTNIFPASGNVGIGTTSPQALLEIRKPGGGRWQFVDEGADVYTAINIRNAANTAFLPLSIRSLGFEISDGTAARFSISNTGNVGIGTYSPNSILHLKSVEPAQTIEATGASNAVWLKGIPTVGFNFNVATVNASPLVFATNNVERMRITPTGNVGIGTASPNYRHTVADDGGNYYASALLSGSIGTPGNYVGLLFGYTGNTYQKCALIYEGSDAYGRGRLYLALEGSANSNNVSKADARLTVDYNGNVGIGTTNPTEKLAVNGRIRAKEVIVETNWSDFVFDPGYRLTPLSEVERQIKAERHLPGIPSAKEVVDGGVRVGDMQAKLLQKIEELTLHAIEQEKEIQALKNQLRSLQHH